MEPGPSGDLTYGAFGNEYRNISISGEARVRLGNSYDQSKDTNFMNKDRIINY